MRLSPAGRHVEHAGLVAEVAGEAFGIGDAVPGLDADIGGAGLGPDAEHRRVGEGDAQLRALRSAIGHRVGADMIPHERVVGEQVVAQRQRAAVER